MKFKTFSLVLFTLVLFNICYASEWGVYRYVHRTTNLRKTRSTNSEIIGKLAPNIKVKADFLKDNWYAVFTKDTAIRDESKAIGYVYAPLLKPTPEPLKSKEAAVLKYKIVEKDDISNRAMARMVNRVVLTANKIPDEASIKQTAMTIWKSGNTGYSDFTIFFYLPEMDTGLMAYSIAEFTPKGLKSFKTEKNALWGTRWWKN